MPARAMPSARSFARCLRSARPASADPTSAMAPSRRLLRPRRLAACRVESDLLARFDAVGKARLDLGKRDRRGGEDAAWPRRCRSVRPRRETARARAARPASTVRAASVRQQKRARRRRRGFWRCARDRRGQAGRRRTISVSVLPARQGWSSRSPPSAPPWRAHRAPRRERSRCSASSRSRKSTSSPPSPRSPMIAAISAAASAAPSARRIDHHARKPRRQRQPPQMPALVGDAAVAVDGAEFGEQRFRLGRAPAAAADRGRRAVPARCPRPRDRARRTTDPRRGFPAGQRASSAAVCGSSHSR